MEQIRANGSRVTYGQVIQLQHEMTNKFLHASSSGASVTDAQNMKVELVRELKKRNFSSFSFSFFLLSEVNLNNNYYRMLV